MHVLTEFSAESLTVFDDISTSKGRTTANISFAKALLENTTQHDLTVTLLLTPPRPIAHHQPSDRSQERLEKFFGRSFDSVILPELPELLKRKPVDVLHRSDPNIQRSLYVRNNLSEYPFVITGVTHSLGHGMFHEWLLPTLYGRPQPCDRIICTSPTGEAVLNSMIASARFDFLDPPELKTALIPLGIFVEEFTGTQESVRSEYGLPASAVVVLSLGRLSYLTKADLLPLLAVFKEVVQRTPAHACLILAGATGPENYSDLLRNAIGEHELTERVIVIENPSEKLKHRLYASSDIFVSLSDNPQETFGLTLLEAAAAGLSVIASDWDGYRSLINDGKTGFLIPTIGLEDCPVLASTAPLRHDATNHFLFSQSISTDSEILTQRLVQLIQNPERRHELGRAARRHAAQFDWKRVIAQYVQLWTELIDEKRKCVRIPGRPPTLNFWRTFDRILAAF